MTTAEHFRFDVAHAQPFLSGVALFLNEELGRTHMVPIRRNQERSRFSRGESEIEILGLKRGRPLREHGPQAGSRFM